MIFGAILLSSNVNMGSGRMGEYIAPGEACQHAASQAFLDTIIRQLIQHNTALDKLSAFCVAQ